MSQRLQSGTDKAKVGSIRKSLGFTQAQLAGLLGVHVLTVSKWERGVLAPSPYQDEMLDAFAKAKRRKPHVAFDALVGVSLQSLGAPTALFLLLKAAFDDPEPGE